MIVRQLTNQCSLLIRLDEPLLDRAGYLGPQLRSLDAVHLSAALSIGTELGVLFIISVRHSARVRNSGV